jgi:hypothetical protein
MKILIFFRWAAKTIAGSYMRVTMGKLMVWALKLDPSLTRIPNESPHQGLSIGVIVKIYLINFQSKKCSS